MVENQGDISLKPFNFSGGMIMESISKFVLENHRPLVFPFTRVTTARTDMRRDGRTDKVIGRGGQYFQKS